MPCVCVISLVCAGLPSAINLIQMHAFLRLSGGGAAPGPNRRTRNSVTGCAHWAPAVSCAARPEPKGPHGARRRLASAGGGRQHLVLALGAPAAVTVGRASGQVEPA